MLNLVQGARLAHNDAAERPRRGSSGVWGRHEGNPELINNGYGPVWADLSDLILVRIEDASAPLHDIQS